MAVVMVEDKQSGRATEMTAGLGLVDAAEEKERVDISSNVRFVDVAIAVEMKKNVQMVYRQR